jgi:hypothetical protein
MLLTQVAGRSYKDWVISFWYYLTVRHFDLAVD